ncbi:glycosyltransferase [Algoriphagus sp.]|uniref:glycosyltransferase n=1 Tax=Algoriphagus sp. TaxID=1872435 RepID=UPI00261192F4|nr:glycosyltransferase [Algoriphagus sp.]
MIWGLVTHPYHRGGVTSWMMDFFKSGIAHRREVRLLAPSPQRPFISSSGKLPISEILEGTSGLISPPVDFRFELGSMEHRVDFYKKLILENLPLGSILIPSDDQAVWRACSELANLYCFIGVLHSDDDYYYQLAERYGDFVAGFVSVSERIKNKVKIPKDHQVIPCGITLNKKPSIVTKKKWISFVGRIEEKQKRVSDLPKVFQKISAQDPEWELILIGNGNDLDQLKDTFTDYGLSKKVHYLGWIPNQEVFDYLSQSQILIQTSNYEGMSVAVMEALSAGCQVMSSAVSGVEDLDSLPNVTSVLSLFPIGNLEKALESFIQLTTKFDPSSTPHQAIELAHSHFSMEACWNRYETFASNLNPQEKVEKPSRSSKLPSDILAMMRLIKYKLTH